MRSKIRVAIAGVGNCASSLIQGVHYYQDAQPTDNVPGLMHVDLGGYHVSDLEFVAADEAGSHLAGRARRISSSNARVPCCRHQCSM